MQGYKAKYRPNFFTLLLVVLAVVWWLGWVKFWVVLLLLVVYVIVAFWLLRRDPKVMQEAQAFGKHIATLPQQKKAEEIKKTLENSVQLRKRR